MPPLYDYGLVTKRRWLWPILDLAALAFLSIRAAAIRRLERSRQDD